MDLKTAIVTEFITLDARVRRHFEHHRAREVVSGHQHRRSVSYLELFRVRDGIIDELTLVRALETETLIVPRERVPGKDIVAQSLVRLSDGVVATLVSVHVVPRILLEGVVEYIVVLGSHRKPYPMHVVLHDVVADEAVAALEEGDPGVPVVFDHVAGDHGAVAQPVREDSHFFVVVDVIVRDGDVLALLAPDDPVVPVPVHLVVGNDETPREVVRIEAVLLVVVDLVPREYSVDVTVRVLSVKQVRDVVVQKVPVNPDVFEIFDVGQIRA